MKKYKYLVYLSLAIAGASGCKKEEFVKANTNPETLYTIDAEKEFLNASIQIHGQDFEAFYDYYRRIMPWMQMTTDQAGNSKNLVTDVGNFNSRYGIFFPTLGAQIADLQYLISIKPEAEKAAFTNVSNIANILKVYYAFYVSDINGSIPYTEAFQGRYGGTKTPKYDKQQELFATFESELKANIAALEATPTTAQVSLAGNDQYFGGDVTKWIKSANALRMRIAMRLLKRDAATATGIFTSILSDANQMASNDDSWAFHAASNFAGSGGNFSVTGLRAPKPTVDYMLKNTDPRIRDFYQKNNYSPANLVLAIANKVYPAGTVWSANQYVGSPTSPDSSLGKYKSWYATKTIPSTPQVILDTISYLQTRIWTPDFNGGTGISTFPVITYADYCYMRAEIAAKGLISTGGTAEQWYTLGVQASLSFWDKVASDAKTEDYVALTPAEVTTYMNSADVKFNTAKALEQIAVQSYLNFEKQPNEAWALYKRTGMPNSSTALKNDDLRIDGDIKQIPRRAALSLPASTDPNYANKQAAITEMQADPNFGSGPTDMFGRVWWDVQ